MCECVIKCVIARGPFRPLSSHRATTDVTAARNAGWQDLPGVVSSSCSTVRANFYESPVTLTLCGRKETQMLRWALIFLVVALIAGALGFLGVAGTAATIAKWLFVIF